jgi:hypothetical protein
MVSCEEPWTARLLEELSVLLKVWHSLHSALVPKSTLHIYSTA